MTSLAERYPQTRRDAQAELAALGNPAPRTRAAKRREELLAIIG